MGRDENLGDEIFLIRKGVYVAHNSVLCDEKNCIVLVSARLLL